MSTAGAVVQVFHTDPDTEECIEVLGAPITIYDDRIVVQFHGYNVIVWVPNDR